MSSNGLCIDVGLSGLCCNNCYKCAYNHDESMEDFEVIERLGIDEQLRMLKEFEEGQ